MWSAGIITATVLSGEAIFAGSLDAYSNLTRDEAYLMASSKCDLSFLDDMGHYVWSEISPACKDFIRALIVLDERARWTASKALSHPWFTENPSRRLFDTRYEKAIRDWRPRITNSLLVERLPEVDPETHNSQPRERTATQEFVSRYFSLQVQGASPISPESDKTMEAIMEDEEWVYEKQHQPSPEVKDSVDEDISTDTCTDSMEQLSISPKKGGKYSDHVQMNASPVEHTSSYPASCQSNSVYAFSLPPPPPDSPAYQEEEPIVIPETPVKRVKQVKPAIKTLKRLAESPSEDSQMSLPMRPRKKRVVYFTDELAKRRQIPERYR